MDTLQNKNINTGNDAEKEQLRRALSEAIERGNVQQACELQGELLAVKRINTPDNPLPEGMHVKVVGQDPIELRGSGMFDRQTVPSEVTAAWDPQDFRFMREAATQDVKTPSDYQIAKQQAQLGVDFTGKFVMNGGEFTAYTGDGRCVYGWGEPEVVTAYLEDSNFAPTTPDKLPDIPQWLHNHPPVARAA